MHEVNKTRCYPNDNRQQKLSDILSIILNSFNLLSINYLIEDIERVVNEAYEEEALEFGKKEAYEWGKDFEWPSDIVIRDSLRLYSHGLNLSAMTAAVHQLNDDRLSIERVDLHVPKTNPDYYIIRELALGMTAPTFDQTASHHLSL
jgi:hypothetical protein